jgi:hypothetical protein
MTVLASVERRGCADGAQGGRLVPRPRQNDSVTMILLLAWSSPDTSFAEPADRANDEERGQVAVSIQRHLRAPRHGSSWSLDGKHHRQHFRRGHSWPVGRAGLGQRLDRSVQGSVEQATPRFVERGVGYVAPAEIRR